MFGFKFPDICTRKSLLFLCLTVGSVVFFSPVEANAETFIPVSGQTVGTSTLEYCIPQDQLTSPYGVKYRTTYGTTSQSVQDYWDNATLQGTGSGSGMSCEDSYKWAVSYFWATPADHDGEYFSVAITNESTITSTTTWTIAIWQYDHSTGEATPTQTLDVDVNETWIVLTEPEKETPYETNFKGYLNFPDKTATTSSWRLSFISSTGEDLSSTTASGTTTETDFYEYSGTVNFEIDDIVYVRAYLYDNDSLSGLPSYISAEYEWWVSADGVAGNGIDLGTFRTSTSTCGSAATWGGALCHSLRLLFIPSSGSIDFIGDKIDDATSTAPFVFVHQIDTYIETMLSADSSSWTITVPTTTEYFGGMPLLSSSQVESIPGYAVLRSAITAGIYLLLVFYVIRRTRSLFGSNDTPTTQGMTIDMRK